MRAEPSHGAAREAPRRARSHPRCVTSRPPPRAWAARSGRHGPRRPARRAGGRRSFDVSEDRVRARDRVEGEEGLERVEVDLAARQGAVRGEEETALRDPVVERLDAEGIGGRRAGALASQSATANMPCSRCAKASPCSSYRCTSTSVSDCREPVSRELEAARARGSYRSRRSGQRRSGLRSRSADRPSRGR